MARPLRFDNVTFFYPAAGEAVFDGLSVELPAGWTGVIGPNGSGKTTLLRLACGELTPTAGRVRRPGGVVYCQQRTDDPPGKLGELLQATDALGCRLRGELGLHYDWVRRWPTLSHGERKRAQIAAALWRRPHLLAIDEPTNHVDAAARALLGNALESFRGVGLLVSHDRELLDGLCRQTLFVEPPAASRAEPPAATLRPGGYTKAVELAKVEEQTARRQRDKAKAEVSRLQAEAVQRRQEAALSHKKRSKSGIPDKDHDAKFRINLARVSGKDGQAGRLLKQMEGRVDQAQDTLADAHVKKDRHLGVRVPGERSKRDALLRLPEGSLPLGTARKLVFPELLIQPTDRIALVGPNGSGKSTLVEHIVSRLDLPAERLVYLAQEIDRAAAQKVLEDVRRMPRARLGQVMGIVSQLGSEPQRVLETQLPSPGELRKIMLAIGMARQPWLIVMDEPTNHLDLPSIECVEKALADCPAALLLVSHDRRFLRALTNMRWQMTPQGPSADVALDPQTAPAEP